MGVGGSGGGFQFLLSSVLLAESEVVGDCTVEEVGVLGDDGYVIPDAV